MFLIAEYAETVVVSGIVTAIFLGAYHIPWFEPTIARTTDGWLGASGLSWLAVFQVFSFVVKMLSVVWVFFVVRWAFPRFRYDQVMRLGWKMMLPISLMNVALSGAVLLAGARQGLDWNGIIPRVHLLFFIAFTQRAPAAAEAGGSGGHSTTAAAH
jgi:NADH-quinone oxidoreductase subunit H